MMITSELIKLKFTNDIGQIERELAAKEPLRWAVVAAEEDGIWVSVSYHAPLQPHAGNL